MSADHLHGAVRSSSRPPMWIGRSARAADSSVGPYHKLTRPPLACAPGIAIDPEASLGHLSRRYMTTQSWIASSTARPATSYLSAVPRPSVSSTIVAASDPPRASPARCNTRAEPSARTESPSGNMSASRSASSRAKLWDNAAIRDVPVQDAKEIYMDSSDLQDCARMGIYG
jgi:hypothetical protein